MSSHSKGRVQRSSLKPVDCSHHTGQKAVNVCLTCKEQFVCSQCVAQDHKGHVIEHFHTHSENKRQKLRTLIQEAREIKLVTIMQLIKSVDGEIAKNKHKSKDVKQKIHQRCSELKSELDKVSSKCVQSCDEIEKNNEKKLQKHKENLQNLFADYKAKIEQCQTIHDQGSDSEVIDSEENFPVQPHSPIHPEACFPMFEVPFTYSRASLEQAFGRVCREDQSLPQTERATTEDQMGSDFISRNNTLLEQSSTQNRPTKQGSAATSRSYSRTSTGMTNKRKSGVPKGRVDREDEMASDILFLKHQLTYTCDVLSEFKLQSDSTSGHAIKSLCPVIAYEQMFVWFWKGKKMHLINRRGLITNVQPIILQIKGTIYDVSCVSELDGKVYLWFCCNEDKSIREVTTQGLKSAREVTPEQTNKIKFHSAEPPLCLCVTQNRNKVLVGMVGKVCMFTASGEMLHTANDSGLQLEFDPYKIIECPATGHFAILDDNGTVTKVDHKLSFLFRFEGKRMTTDDISVKTTGYTPVKDFYSLGLCFDNDGKMLIADFYNQCIILVNPAGHYIQTIMTDKNLRPYVINKNKDGTMWVGFEGGTMKLIKFR